MKVWKNGEKVQSTYEAVCEDLGFIAQMHFVEVTTANTITFTMGKPDEVWALLSAVESKGYKPAKSLLRAAGR